MGYWVKCDFARFEGGGAIGSCPSVPYAELMAAATALGEAYLRGAFPRHGVYIGWHHHVVFGIDNMQVVNLINSGRNPRCPQMMSVFNQMLELKKLVGFTWRAKHVKAHTSGRTPREWVNNRCDVLSKEYRNGN